MFEPESRKIPEAVEQPSPCTMTTEPVLWSRGLQPLSPCAKTLCSATREAPAMRGSPSTTGEMPVQQQRPNTANNEHTNLQQKIKQKEMCSGTSHSTVDKEPKPFFISV